MWIVYIILFVLIFLFLVCSYNIYWLKSQLKNTGAIPLEDLILKNGDVILFETSKNNMSNIIQMLYSQTPYTHIGVVYIKNGEAYLLESHPTHYGDKSGIQLHPFSSRVKNYKGELYYRGLKGIPSKEQNELFERFVNDHNDYPTFPSTYQIVQNYMNRCMLGDRNLEPPYNCSELVSIVLHKILGHNCLRYGCESPRMSSFETVLEKPLKIISE